jgi:hypothetical protein
MDDGHFPDRSSASMAKLVSALHDVRNAMVELSLVLQDWRFELDASERQTAAEMTQQLMEDAKRPD